MSGFPQSSPSDTSAAASYNTYPTISITIIISNIIIIFLSFLPLI